MWTAKCLVAHKSILKTLDSDRRHQKYLNRRKEKEAQRTKATLRSRQRTVHRKLLVQIYEPL